MGKTLDFDPLEQAESLMAGAAQQKHSDGILEMTRRREEIRDLLMLSIAKSLAILASPKGE